MSQSVAIPHPKTNEERGGSLLSASTLLGPATFVVALGLLLPILILLRYSFNRFEPRVMMVEAVTLENYVKFFTEKAVIIGIIAVNLPYMVLTLQSVIEGIARNLEEAAFSLGAGPWTMFRRVLWPLALPGIIAGAILCFILAMNAYATPVLLGGPQFKMMGPLVFGQFRLNNWPFGAAIAFVLMTATLVLTAAANLLIQQRYGRGSSGPLN